MSEREKIFSAVSRAAADLLLSNRVDDPSLPPGAIDQAVNKGVVSPRELGEHFAREVERLVDPTG